MSSPDERNVVLVPSCMMPDELKEAGNTVGRALAEAEAKGVFGFCQLILLDGEGMTSLGVMGEGAAQGDSPLHLWRATQIRQMAFMLENFGEERLAAELTVALVAAREARE